MKNVKNHNVSKLFLKLGRSRQVDGDGWRRLGTSENPDGQGQLRKKTSKNPSSAKALFGEYIYIYIYIYMNI